ncbi:MAG: hypothetical protein IJ652_01190 [Bacteroidales bacterium]|nr:hypothetical protein [Bacteroidales bacterium]
MKQLFLPLLASLFLGGTLAASATSAETPFLIQIKTKPVSTEAPRSVAPISATVDDETGILDIHFANDIGIVHVELWELNGNGYASQNFNSTDGHAQMLLPATGGDFRVVFSTSDGNDYEGYFSL